MAVVDNFLVFKKAVQNKLEEMEKTGKEFYETNTETDIMWNTYLETIPKKINPIFRQRRVYDCCCCRHFIKQVGNIVIINDDNTLTSIWDVEIGDEGFDTVAKKLSEYVKSRPILDVFRTKFNKFGQEYNWDNVDDIKWEHFVYDVPSRFISRDVSGDVAVFRDNRFVFNRSLAEITDEAYSTVLDLINDNILYRGEEYKNAVSKMYKFKKEYDKLADSEKMAYSWRVSAGLPSSVCKIRNTAIGTLLIDLSDGVDVETAVKKYENVVAPANYKRPKAIFTQKMLEDAIRSEGVEEVFSTDIDMDAEMVDLFSEEYLARINRIKLPNTKVKILAQLLKKKVNEFKKVNKIKAKTFEERLQSVLDNYNNRMSDSEYVKNILDDVSAQLMDLLQKLKEEENSFNAMGIDYEEKAFFDILVAVAEKFKFEFPESENIELAKEIRAAMRDKEKYSDWANSTQIKALMQADIIMILAKHGYPPVPPEIYEKVYNDILEQAENFKKYSD